VNNSSSTSDCTRRKSLCTEKNRFFPSTFGFLALKLRRRKNKFGLLQNNFWTSSAKKTRTRKESRCSLTKNFLPPQAVTRQIVGGRRTPKKLRAKPVPPRSKERTRKNCSRVCAKNNNFFHSTHHLAPPLLPHLEPSPCLYLAPPLLPHLDPSPYPYHASSLFQIWCSLSRVYLVILVVVFGSGPLVRKILLYKNNQLERYWMRGTRDLQQFERFLLP